MQLTQEVLAAALAGLEEQKKRIEAHIAEVRAQMGKRGPGRPPAAAKSASSTSAAAAPGPGRRKKRQLSAEGRARIIAAAKKRWAAFRKTKTA
jgi:hypothetical protein